MDKIKPLPTKKVIRALEKIGFKQIRQKGSHLFMRHPDGRTTLITIHVIAQYPVVLNSCNRKLY